MIALNFHLPGQIQQGQDGGNEDRRGFASAPGSHKTPNRLGEEKGSRGVGCVHPHTQARNVHAFGDHTHSDHPFIGRLTEFVNALRCISVIGENNGWTLPRNCS